MAQSDATLDRESPTIRSVCVINVDSAKGRQIAEELRTELIVHIIERYPQRPKPFQLPTRC